MIAQAAGARDGGLPGSVPPAVLSLVVVVLVVGALLGVDRALALRARRRESWRIRRQVTMLALSLVGVIVVVLTLPVEESTEGQLLGLLGIAITAALTLASTTFVGNMMAGLMLRAVDNIRLGCFIQVGEQFGRVTERGLFHVEIQTEDRDLSTLPNMYLVTNPVKVVSASGTIISAQVSLGYDTHHAVIEDLLLEAIGRAGLSDGFVQIVELGDFSVTYRAAGFEPEVKQLLSTRSKLRRAMLDALHGGGVEIVSPTFMNQRPMMQGERVIPRAPARRGAPEKSDGAAPESIMFEKAEEAEKIETLREKRAEAAASIESVKAELKAARDDAERERLGVRLERHERVLEAIEERIATRQAQVNDDRG
ncbi:MAG: mechanosensitive ion channel [Phycisphaeraceae bacterium]|nr:mechanosensitive ion channel [Phycisphaeraceae bacterium]MCB9847209.1 mechanosensitive ion channel [Phycisphaeraceae bacterium]